MRIHHLAMLAPVLPMLLATAPAPQTDTPGSEVLHLPPERAEAILGRAVVDADGITIGRLIDVLVDETGHPQAAVIDFGGFMGVGNRRIAVQWSTLRFTPGDAKRKITLEMTPAQIKAAPQYSDVSKPAPVVTPVDAAARAEAPIAPR